MNHKNFVRISLLLFLFIYGINAFAQNDKSVKGKVVEAVSGEPLIGVNVFVKGTTIGTTTDLDGMYEIPVSGENDVLIFSCIGSKTQEINVGKKNVIDVILQEDVDLLDEVVVVVAYGTQSKVSVTSAMASIDNKELMKSPVANISNSIAGSISGVSSIQSSGQPGEDDAALFIRGTGSLNSSLSSPLILVDGVERPFSQMDPNEIESISVLKDASATAVFGVRGANGVILVTTKQGKVGKSQISISSSVGLQQPISLTEQVGSYEYSKFWNTKQSLDGITNPKAYFTQAQIEAYRTGSDPIMYPNVNWMDYMFNDVSVQSKNNINISGGNEKIRYFVSLGYLYQDGILKQMPGQSYNNNYRYDRFNYRANVDANLSPSTYITVGIGGYLGINRKPRNIVSDSGNGNEWAIAQIWTTPLSGPGFVDGKRTLIGQGVLPLTGQMRDGLFVFYGYGYDQRHDTTLNLNVKLTQKLDIITQGLSISIKGAYDNKFILNKIRRGGNIEFQRVVYKSFFDQNGKLPETDPDFDKSYIFTPASRNTPLSYSETSGRDQNWYFEGRIDYNRTFNNHKVSALLLYNQSRDYYPSTYAYIPRGYIGLVGRATYSYENRYMADFSIGYNGSENFAPGKTRFGVFPSFSIGWVLSNEKFWRNMPWWNFFKIRASWGRVGNDKGISTRFMYMPEVWSPDSGYSFGTSNPVLSPAYSSNKAGNPDVTWETADKINVGLETKFLNNRLKFNVDLFAEYRRGILITPNSIPGIIATNASNMNLGKVNNHGYEIELGWSDQTASGFGYYINANMSYAKNKILYMDEIRNAYDYMNITGGSTGRHSGLYIFDRLYQYSDFEEDLNGNLTLNPDLPQPQVPVYPGDAKYQDLNNDNIVDGNDKCVTGFSSIPEYFFGINMGLNYKGFSFSMQWTGATNVNKMYDIEYRIPFTNVGDRGLLKQFYDGCWTPTNQFNAQYPRPSEISERWNSEPSTLWLKDASYLRLKNLTLGYTFSGYKAFQKIGLHSIAITFSGNNLLTISPLKYIDPEGNTGNLGSYPLVKIYSLGLNLNF